MKGQAGKQAARYDATEFLENDAEIVTYLEDGDPSLVSAALGDIARVRDVAQLAGETSITRDGL